MESGDLFAENVSSRLKHTTIYLTHNLNRYGEQRLEAACKRALHFGVNTYKGIESVLKSGSDKLPLPLHLPIEADEAVKEQLPKSLHHDKEKSQGQVIYFHATDATEKKQKNPCNLRNQWFLSLIRLRLWNR